MGKRILIAEDDKDVGDILTHLLSSREYDIELAADGQEALDKLAVQRFDLLIVDLAMPNVDGWTVIREVRTRKETEKLPTLVLTACAFGADQEKAIQAGCDIFLTKPFEPYQVLQKIEQLLSTR
jgi:CheY-like chemotaxis protein